MRTKGRNCKSSRYSFKANYFRCEYNKGDYRYLPISRFCAENFLTRSQVYKLLRQCKLYGMTHKGRVLVKWVDENLKDGLC